MLRGLFRQPGTSALCVRAVTLLYDLFVEKVRAVGQWDGASSLGEGSLPAPVLELQQITAANVRLNAAFPCHRLLFSLCVSLTPENGN